MTLGTASAPLADLIRRYADGLLDRHAFIDAVAALDLAPSSTVPAGMYDEVVLPRPDSFAEVERAYLSGLLDSETFRDIYAARRLRDRAGPTTS